MSQEISESGTEFKVGKFQAYFTLVVCCLLFLINFMDRQLFSVVLEPMKKDLGLTDWQVGLIQTVFLICIALFSYPVARLVDRWSRRKSIAIMAILWSAFTYVTGLGYNFISLLLPRIGVALGESAFSTGGSALLSATFSPKSRGKILGIFNMMMALGVMMGVVVGGYLSANCGGWRVPFFIFAIPGIIFGIVAFFIKDYKTVEKKNTADGRGFFKDIARLMKIPTLKYMFIGYGLQNFAIYTMMAWGPAVLMRAMHIGEDKAGMIAGLVVLVSLLSLPVGGILADTWYRKNIKARLLLPMIGSLISPLMVIIAMMALYFNMFAVAIIFCALSGISGLGTGAVNAASQDVVAPGMRGMSWGLAIFFMYLIGGWSPVMIGILSDMMGGGATGLEFAMMIGAAISTPAALCNWIASRHYASDFDKVKDYIIAAEK